MNVLTSVSFGLFLMFAIVTIAFFAFMKNALAAIPALGSLFAALFFGWLSLSLALMEYLAGKIKGETPK